MAFPRIPEVFTHQGLGAVVNWVISPVTWPATAAVRGFQSVGKSLKPSNILRRSMHSAPVLTLGLGAAAGAGLYSHFAQPQITSLPEPDADALAAAQAQAQRDFLDKTPAMEDPRMAPMQQAMALQAQMEGASPAWADKMTAAREPKPLYAANDDLPTMTRAESAVGGVQHTGTVPVASLSQYGVPAPQQALGV